MPDPHEMLAEPSSTSRVPTSRTARPGAKRMTLSCENCQRRKTKCDARQPACANCEALGVQCSTRKPTRKRGRHAKTNDDTWSTPNEPQQISTPLRSHEVSLIPVIAASNEAGPFDLHSHGRDGSVSNEQGEMLDPSPAAHPFQSYDILSATPQPDWTIWNDITPGAVISPSPSFAQNIGVKPLFEALSHGLNAAGIGVDHVGYIASCIELFFGKIYPTYPVVYRPRLAEAIEQLGLGVFDLDHKTFALLTATCSYTLAVLPVTTSSNTWPAATVFYRSSRAALAQYTEEDIENPDHTSLVIRMFQSGWAHVAGKRRTSWNMLGECIRLAQAMRLHDESTYTRMSHLEGQMCRRAFWTLYTGDKSSAVLGGHPVCLKETIFRDVETVGYPVPLGDQDAIYITLDAGNIQELNILTGFNANQDLWRTAERLLDFDHSCLDTVAIDQAQANRSQTLLDALLSDFYACLDNLPTCLSFYPDVSPIMGKFAFQAETDRLQIPEAMAIQRTNLQVSHLCLKLLVIRRLYEPRPTLGFRHDERCKTPSLHIADSLGIARDLLYVIHTSSIELIRLNGEACVEKIRLIGASVLELIANNPDIPTHSVLRQYQELFPHILALLDSKASEAADG
ncbi:hypothetical protein AUEXF2481DRAFT_167384 [Aureobasidium subglaciale EXF-2481]|uniref:Zn(2)-C6 fungal-type domain-containing protein n=1 Tax=Aureobasidium subglaciale (strain EXF-2481) TaxID=1043005 RepID=A0A074Z3M7_AURSE|nr:uncharacterized protein AUEXF2481DRAFT_167384 [Aureobasidium subglaciale EXF-2481]KAI5200189.1 hypothetical protein E4T38_06614 [Aureobasidium subglaciale]KAI5218021.1 hypothetical protein E4T40_07115 [Aureobasidium subglaciale]KAI5221663.1 hypothetical protein E4T41_07035 [Aureobasidium subglaciale]KAI5259110.1 hypothetical protein E4T46_07013 [Aureobasidium subglaciale]KER00918.1 hypothetical protein AUEXF2481DRAFT_167384 [Aureobasidium subglaciale EXF-2481]